MTDRPKLITTHDLAAMLQMDPSTISKWVDKGMLLAYRTPGGHRRIRAQDTIDFLQRHGIPIPPELRTTDAPPPVERRQSSRPRLLVLDDGQTLQKTAAELEKAFSLTITSSPLEAMLMLAEQRPAFMLIELALDFGGGLEVVKTVREHDTLKAVRVATMTAAPSSNNEKKSAAAGAEACFAKPIDVAQVSALFVQGKPAPQHLRKDDR